MDLYWLSRTLEDNPAIRVLRAENGPIILGFLHRAFKEHHLITIANQDLVLQLAAFLEEQGYEEGADGDVVDRAATLLENWCGEKSRYLRKYNDDRGVVQHELTPALETVLRWLEDLQPRDFVGTESRFQNLLHRLRELVQGSGEDPQRRIRELEEKRAELDSRIALIRATGQIDSYTAVQIRERLQELGRDARDLLADFRQVEQNFRDLVREIHREQGTGERDRGSLLGLTLEMVDQLHESPQGQSFDAFWRYLVADSGRDEMNHLVQELFARVTERGEALPDALLGRLKTYLHQAGKKVVDGNRILSEKLSRILAERTRRELARTRELIAEIKQLALQAVDNPPASEEFLFLETEPRIRMVMDRPLSVVQRETRFDRAEPADERLDAADVATLFSQLAVDEKRLRGRIAELLETNTQVSLTEVLDRYPVEEGLAEVVTYLTLATLLHPTETDAVSYRHGDRVVRVVLPRAVYSR